MLRVLLVYYEPIPSGQTAHVLSLARELDRRTFRPLVVLPASLRRSIAAFRQASVEVIPLPLSKVAWPPRSVLALLHLIRRRGIDIVHVHSQEAGLLARPVAWTAGARVVYTPQVIDIGRDRWHWLYVLLERTWARLTDVIISVNAPDRERLVRWGVSPGKVVSIPNGIDLGPYAEPPDTESIRRELGLDDRQPLTMQVGRLSRQKDPLTFAEGAALVLRNRPDAQFALVGEGPLRDAVASRVRELRLQGRVRLLGWRDKAYRLMAAADVVTLTSRWEGMPYTLLEAMAWSRPVVATAVNGCPEVVIDGLTGFLVAPGDAAAWAQRVLDLLNDPAGAAAMGQRGRRRVEERFSLREMVARIERLYLQVAGALE